MSRVFVRGPDGDLIELETVESEDKESSATYDSVDDNWRTLMAHLGILLTNVASALNAGRKEEAIETLQRARELHADLMEKFSG